MDGGVPELWDIGTDSSCIHQLFARVVLYQYCTAPHVHVIDKEYGRGRVVEEVFRPVLCCPPFLSASDAKYR